MAVFDFFTITPEQALDFTVDDLLLVLPGSAREASVAFSGPADSPTSITLRLHGHAVEFGPAIQGAHFLFTDTSFLAVGNGTADNIRFGPQNDALFGGGGDDTLSGGDGDNVLQGNQGNDLLATGRGADTIFGGKGDDFVTTGLGDSTTPEAGDFAQGNLGNDTITGGNGSDTLLGGQGNDLITGGRGQDFLDGNLGDDRIVADDVATAFGEAGNDTLVAHSPGVTLSGGDGADLFFFDIPSLTIGGGIPANAARIVDWTIGDHIAFANVSLDHAYREIVEVAPTSFESAFNAANQVIATSVDPLRAGGEVVVEQVGGDLFVFAADAGSTAVDTVVRIVGRSLADISASDFLF